MIEIPEISIRTLKEKLRGFSVPSLLPERIRPINKLDITIDKENNIKLNTPITLQQAWNYFYALNQCPRNGPRKLEYIRSRWFGMTDLMRNEYRLIYQELLQNGKDVWDNQHVDLRLILSENISVLTGVKYKFIDNKIVLQDEVNLNNAEKYFNELNNPINNGVNAFEILSHEEKLEYRDAYLELLSSGRDLYNGKIVPLTGAPSEDDDHPYIEPEPEPEPEAAVGMVKKLGNTKLRDFYVSLATPHYYPSGIRGPLLSPIVRQEFPSLSKEQWNHCMTIYLDRRSRKKESSPKKQVSSGTDEFERDFRHVYAWMYFRFKAGQDGAFSVSLSQKWSKLSKEERNKYGLEYQKILNSGYCIYNKKLIPIQEKANIESRKPPAKFSWGGRAFRYYCAKRAVQLRTTSTKAKEIREEWNKLDSDQRDEWVEELKRLVYEGKGECNSPTIIKLIVKIRRALNSQSRGVTSGEQEVALSREEIWNYFATKRTRELADTEVANISVAHTQKKEWNEISLQEYDRLEREYKQAISHSKDAIWPKQSE
ncbi:uncharacterized protein J8A68_004899 [[Candida] subhashii]|uniref:Uncharacterized protein n=1 Tax=[Candida] subhashii TaxID=561895 RepID=A0A8J5QQ42_9ASCO|nr:uncharacterized protein J8A68_004899 [[Candida] subhashii]KAG7661630.1 hypothetical protein J8A68_004899 [[Candida] subhashii]